MIVAKLVSLEEIESAAPRDASATPLMREFLSRAAGISAQALCCIRPIVATKAGRRFRVLAGVETYFMAKAMGLDAVSILVVEDREVASAIPLVDRLFAHVIPSPPPTESDWKACEATAGFADLGRDLRRASVREVFLAKPGPRPYRRKSVADSPSHPGTSTGGVGEGNAASDTED